MSIRLRPSGIEDLVTDNTQRRANHVGAAGATPQRRRRPPQRARYRRRQVRTYRPAALSVHSADVPPPISRKYAVRSVRSLPATDLVMHRRTLNFSGGAKHAGNISYTNIRAQVAEDQPEANPENFQQVMSPY